MEPEQETQKCEYGIIGADGFILCTSGSAICPKYNKKNTGITLLINNDSYGIANQTSASGRLPLCLSRGMKPLEDKLETKNG